MDAVKFLKEARRMCKCYPNCVNCSAYTDGVDCPIGYIVDCLADNAIDTVEIVEKWSKEHPRKTRQSVFLKQYPEVIFDEHGVLDICPMNISADHRDKNGECRNPKKRCIDCRRGYWTQEVEK